MPSWYGPVPEGQTHLPLQSDMPGWEVVQDKWGMRRIWDPKTGDVGFRNPEEAENPPGALPPGSKYYDPKTQGWGETPTDWNRRALHPLPPNVPGGAEWKAPESYKPLPEHWSYLPLQSGDAGYEMIQDRWGQQTLWNPIKGTFGRDVPVDQPIGDNPILYPMGSSGGGPFPTRGGASGALGFSRDVLKAA